MVKSAQKSETEMFGIVDDFTDLKIERQLVFIG